MAHRGVEFLASPIAEAMVAVIFFSTLNSCALSKLLGHVLLIL
jgi:hypothetical protein